MQYKLENYTQLQMFMTYLKRHAINDSLYINFKHYLMSKPYLKDWYKSQSNKDLYSNVGTFVDFITKNYPTHEYSKYHNYLYVNLYKDWYFNFIEQQTNAKQYDNIVDKLKNV